LIDESGNANNWMMIPLVDQLRVAGVHLQSGRCYSFLIPPVLGGDYTTENAIVIPIFEHFGVYGSYHGQLSSVPDGTKVVIKAEKQSESHSVLVCPKGASL